MFKTKSVHTKIEPRKDGLRILAARGRGRGLPSDRFRRLDGKPRPERAAERLRSSQVRYPGKNTAAVYLAELREPGGIDRRNDGAMAKQRNGLGFGQVRADQKSRPEIHPAASPEDEKHCHRHLLKALLERKI